MIELVNFKVKQERNIIKNQFPYFSLLDSPLSPYMPSAVRGQNDNSPLDLDYFLLFFTNA